MQRVKSVNDWPDEVFGEWTEIIVHVQIAVISSGSWKY